MQWIKGILKYEWKRWQRDFWGDECVDPKKAPKLLSHRITMDEAYCVSCEDSYKTRAVKVERIVRDCSTLLHDFGSLLNSASNRMEDDIEQCPQEQMVLHFPQAQQIFRYLVAVYVNGHEPGFVNDGDLPPWFERKDINWDYKVSCDIHQRGFDALNLSGLPAVRALDTERNYTEIKYLNENPNSAIVCEFPNPFCRSCHVYHSR
jgi:hypothetical protein